MSLFYQGGPLFMSILTLIGLAMIVWSVVVFIQSKSASVSPEVFPRKAQMIKSIGTLALVFGILGQFIGLYSAFVAIESVGAVSPAMLAGGLKVSSITTIYGLIIYIISYLIWLGIESVNFGKGSV